MPAESSSPAEIARRVVRSRDQAVLATSLRETGGWPYASLVLTALDHDGTPLLLISQLADHTRNIAADERVSLLFDGTAGREDPLTGPRVSVQGRARRSDEPRHRARFLARHPAARLYADFGDFGLYAVDVERAHLVAGFGRITWLERRDMILEGDFAALAAAEAGLVAGLSADALARRLGLAGEGWQVTGLDPEGADLRRGAAVARFDYGAMQVDPAAVERRLVGQ
ncbi:MAG TPA: pyridoxamine 5'-phosphate oxidase family protein [Alphaproteobacteria bacterium]|nr:pyridoxamine 5'-phosphate oxidase family protein [Alphaproteobacteria bacterium]